MSDCRRDEDVARGRMMNKHLMVKSWAKCYGERMAGIGMRNIVFDNIMYLFSLF